MLDVGPRTWLTDCLVKIGSLAVLLGFDAADRLDGGPSHYPGVVAGQVDGDRVGGDVDGDDAPGMDAAEGDLLPGDHDHAGVASQLLTSRTVISRNRRVKPPWPSP